VRSTSRILDKIVEEARPMLLSTYGCVQKTQRLSNRSLLLVYFSRIKGLFQWLRSAEKAA